MKITYDPETNTLSIRLRESQVAESAEIQEGVILDYDPEGRVVGLELLDASESVTEPQNIVFESKGHLAPSHRAGV